MTCDFVSIDLPGWLYCHACERFQRGTSADLHRACRPELPTFKNRPDGSYVAPPRPHGPGIELTRLLKSLDVTDRLGCGCKFYARQMDRWGIDGCRERRTEIVAKLQDSAAKLGWQEKLIVGGKLGLQPWWSIADRYGSIVDEAIRRATIG